MTDAIWFILGWGLVFMVGSAVALAVTAVIMVLIGIILETYEEIF